jgi:hypothetical protein
VSVAASLGYTLSGTGLASATGSAALTFTGGGGPGRLELTGAQTYVVDLAMMPAAGLRGLLVVVDSLDAAGTAISAPVTLTWTSNAVTKSEKLMPSADAPAFLALANPAPVTGITALSIVTTANAVVHVSAVG